MDTGARLAIFAIMDRNVIGGRTESMCRLTHVILSVSIKNHTVVGTSAEIKRMPLT